MNKLPFRVLRAKGISEVHRTVRLLVIQVDACEEGEEVSNAPLSYVSSEKVSKALAKFGFKAEVVDAPIKWYVKRGSGGKRNVAIMNARANGLPEHLGAPCSMSVFDDGEGDYVVSLAFDSVSLLIASMEKVL